MLDPPRVEDFVIGYANIDFDDTLAFISQDLVHGILETDKRKFGKLRCVG